MKPSLSIELPTEEASRNIAKCLATCLQFPLVATFKGELGAGKTTFIRALLQGFGVDSSIKSPTFSLVESYEVRAIQIHHFDLYRIQDENELDYIGFSDYFSGDAICCIEWPERAASYHALVDIECNIQFKGDGRAMQMQAHTAQGEDVLSCLARKL